MTGKNNFITAEFNVSPILIDGKPGILGVGRDVTSREKVEKELQKMQRLESIGLLAGGIAHDFNNILTGIMGNISLAKIYAESNNAVKERLVDAEKASIRAKELTNQLLTFAKGGTPVRKTASLKEIIEESAMFALHGSSIFCDFQIAADLLPAEVDTTQISQVIQNLVINGVQAMPDGGTMIISAFNCTIDDSSFFLSKGKYLKIMVKDNGVGMNPEIADKIFDPFFTTKPTGNGLGLATCFNIIKNHDGHVSVDTVPGNGSTFTVYLPATDSLLPNDEAKEQREHQILGGRILFMDDDEFLRETAGEIFEYLGLEIDFALDGIDAVEKYRKSLSDKKPYDIVILDITVPGGVGGKEAIPMLLNLNPSVKAIVSSGYSSDPVMAKYQDFGFAGVLVKPYLISEVKKVLREILG